MKNGILIFVLLISGFAFSQTTINLENQCNCEVIKGTDVTVAGTTTPIADQGDIYINTNTGVLYFWNGSSWELTSGKNTVNKTFIVDGSDLVITDSDGNKVSVALADIVAGVNTDDQNATEVSYDNTTSGLTATNTQSAIDEVASGSSDDQNLESATLGTDNILSLGIEDGTGVTVDLSPLDESAE
ncbi:hypothetical protein, partial [Galbibacter pacificus]